MLSMKNMIRFLHATLLLAFLSTPVLAQKPEIAQSASSQATQLLQDKVENHFSLAVAEYNQLSESDNGKILNSDIAIQLSPEYLKDQALVGAVRVPAQKFIARLYAEKLAERPQPGFGVLFSAGGTGAGKTTSLNMLSSIVEHTEIVYDTTLSNLSRSTALIEKALKSGRNVTVIYVYRDPVEAFVNGVLPRAVKMGRMVVLSYHVDSHVGARQVQDALLKKYADDPRVNLIAVDNSRGWGNQTIVALNTLPAVNAKDLLQTLTSELERARKDGRISEAAYQVAK